MANRKDYSKLKATKKSAGSDSYEINITKKQKNNNTYTCAHIYHKSSKNSFNIL